MKDLTRYKKVVATLCYVQKDGKTLMLHRNKKENDMHAGKHNGLGGKCEPGEDPYTCVMREVKEESGLDIQPIYFGNITFEDFMPGQDWEVHMFRTDGYDGELKECDDGDLVWVDTKDIMQLNLWPGDRIFLKYLDTDKFFFAKFKYDAGEVVDHKILLTQLKIN